MKLYVPLQESKSWASPESFYPTRICKNSKSILLDKGSDRVESTRKVIDAKVRMSFDCSGGENLGSSESMVLYFWYPFCSHGTHAGTDDAVLLHVERTNKGGDGRSRIEHQCL